MNSEKRLKRQRMVRWLPVMGWNGKGMWITYSPGSVVPAEKVLGTTEQGVRRADWRMRERTSPCLTMKTATGEILMGWLAVSVGHAVR